MPGDRQGPLQQGSGCAEWQGLFKGRAGLLYVVPVCVVTLDCTASPCGGASPGLSRHWVCSGDDQTSRGSGSDGRCDPSVTWGPSHQGGGVAAER